MESREIGMLYPCNGSGKWPPGSHAIAPPDCHAPNRRIGDGCSEPQPGGFSNLRVLVAGDFMLDEYLWGRVERISPEAPVAVVEVERETRTLGGAGNVVNNLVALGAQVEVLGLVGDDNPGHLLTQELVRLGVAVDGLFTDPSRAHFPEDQGHRRPPNRWCASTGKAGPRRSPTFEAAAREFLSARLPGLQALVLSDYAKGVLTPALLKELIAQGRSRGYPVVVDPKGAGLFPLRRGHGDHPQPQGSRSWRWATPWPAGRTWQRAGAGSGRTSALDYLLITLGAEGMLLFAGGAPPLAIPTRAREVFDVSGAGDTVAALMALGLAQWGDPVLAATLANLGRRGGGGQGGHRPGLSEPSWPGSWAGRGPGWRKKSWTPAELKLLASQLQAQGKKVVFTNGCFDLLHGGHIKFLEESRRLGDALVVAVDTDASVRQVKGEGRPVIGEEQRLRILAALAAVDYVTVFDQRSIAGTPGRPAPRHPHQGQ